MLQAILAGVAEVFSWPTFLYVMIGSAVGQVFGVLPGLSGSIAMALLIPMTFGMSAAEAMALLGGAMGAVTFGGAITAILFNTPGTPNNAATCLDGYPMAKQGKAGVALGAAATASALGAIFGLVVLTAVIPIMRQIVLAFGPPEYFMLAIFGLTIIASVSEGSFLNGLIAGAFGLFLSMIGLSPVAIDKRFTFGTLYLWDGIELVPALIGLFAIAEMINLVANSKSVSRTGTVVKGGILEGILSVFKHFWLFIRCCVIGTFIGAIPGIGGSVSNFVAYAHAVQTEKDGKFGQGDVRGVIASEASNDSKDGGALMPTLALGIPGSPTAAVLLGGLLIHGIFPGKQLMVDELPLVFTLVITLVVANLYTSTVGLLLGNWLTKITTAPTTILAPIVLVLTTAGAYASRNNLGDIFVAVIIGIMGYLMSKFQVSRVPVIIGLVLGSLAEQSFSTALQISRGSYAVFFTRPYSLALFVLTIVGAIYPFYASYRKRHKAPGAAEN